MYIPDHTINAIIDSDVLPAFDFTLHSGSTLHDIACACSEALRDHGHKPTRSLCLMMAKRAKLAWSGEVDRVQQACQITQGHKTETKGNQ